MIEKRTLSVALEPWAKPGQLPRYFRLFAFGENESTKGSVWLTHESAFRCLKAFRDYGNELSGDYEHAVTKSNHEGAPASCWFRLAIRQDGIYAVNVKWTKRASQYLRNREYRYFSPYFTVEQDDRGRWVVVEIINVALTNVPATKRQRPLVSSIWSKTAKAKHSKGSEMITPALIEKLKAAFKESGAPEEILDKLALAAVSQISAMYGSEEMPPAEMPTPEPELLTDPMPEDKKDEAMAKEEEPMPQAYKAAFDALNAQIKALSTQVANFSAQDKKRKAEEKEALFGQYKKEGRFRFSNEKTARELMEKHGLDSFRLVYDSVTPLTTNAAPASPSHLPTINEISKDKTASFTAIAPVFAQEEVKSFLTKPENKGKTTAQALIELSRSVN